MGANGRKLEKKKTEHGGRSSFLGGVVVLSSKSAGPSRALFIPDTCEARRYSNFKERFF